MPKASPRAIEMIVQFEVGSRAAYERRYRMPVWPGAASGVTIGIGYDVGHADPGELARLWSPYLPPAAIAALQSVCGRTGNAARVALPAVKPLVDVPWEAAHAVFRESTLPKFEALTSRALDHCDELSGDAFGALVSLTYNRGASYGRARNPADAKDRFREMRAIKAHMAARRFAAIPPEIRAMERLWPTLPGLKRRRHAEADLFADGLVETKMAA